MYRITVEVGLCEVGFQVVQKFQMLNVASLGVDQFLDDMLSLGALS